MRHAALLAVALILGGLFGIQANPAAPPIDPPGTVQVIEPVVEITVPPPVDDDDPVIPPPPFSIVVEIEGEVITDEVVVLPQNKLAYLRVVGPEVTPTAGKQLPMAQWTRNRAIPNWRQHDVVYLLGDGDEKEVIVGYDHGVSMTCEAGVSHLVQVGVSNADPIKPPHLAQRWIVSGSGPQPPPGPGPGPGPAPKPPVVKPTDPASPSAITSVTYIYEKDDGAVPSGVRVALDKLNRRGILATEFEDDSTDGDGDVPLQYQIPLDAARAKSPPGELKPSLVVMRGTTPEVWHDVRTEQDVMEAAK